MLDAKTAKMVMEAVNKGDGVHYGNIISLTDARRMTSIEISENGGYPVLAMQKGDMTILVWIRNDGEDLNVARVKFVTW